MGTRTRQPLIAWFLAWDLAAAAGGWVAAYLLRFEAGVFPVYKDVPEFGLCLAGLPLVLVLAAGAFRAVGLYDVHRLRRFREELVAVARGTGLAVLLVTATTFAGRPGYESRGVMGLFAGLTFVLVLAARRATWTAVGRLRARGYNRSNALVVGSGRLARRTARALDAATWVGIHVVGYVDDGPFAPADRPLVGPIDALPELVARHRAEHVFVALPLARYADTRRVFDALARTTADVRLVADVPALAAVSLTTSHLHGMAVIGLRESPHVGLNRVVKRAMDVMLSAAALVLLAPVLAAIAVLVKATSPGPVLYRQERCSLAGRPFFMLKFRTMRADAEAHTGAVFTAPADPRRTPAGAFLRATNLDELPQLWNVLAGDMSLVGPRPERPEFVRRFARTIPNYMTRHAVKTGMTGWAQVNGWRGNSSLRKRVQYDLYYITHWNPAFDLRILALTVWRMAVGRQKNAY